MPGGRPTLLTPVRKKKLLALIRKGIYLETAAYAVGIHPRSFFWWMQRGEMAFENPKAEKSERIYMEFSHAVKRALAYAEIDLLEKVRQGGEHWQRWSWIAERRWPAKFGKRTLAEQIVTKEVSRLLGKAREVLPDEQMDKLEQALSAPDDTIGVIDATHERDPGGS